MIQELIEKIKNFININDFSNAKKLLDTIKNEDNPLILYYRGFTNHKLGNNKEAIENLKKIILNANKLKNNTSFVNSFIY